MIFLTSVIIVNSEIGISSKITSSTGNSILYERSITGNLYVDMDKPDVNSLFRDIEKLNFHIHSYLKNKNIKLKKDIKSYDMDYGSNYRIYSKFDEQTSILQLTISLTYFEGPIVFIEDYLIRDIKSFIKENLNEPK